MAEKKNGKTAAQANVEEILKKMGEEAPAPEGFDEITYRNPLEFEGAVVGGVYKDKIQKNIGGKPVQCYRVENDDGIHTIIGAAQIDTFFEAVEPGDRVWIQRGPEIKAGKHGRVTVYRTYLKKEAR